MKNDETLARRMAVWSALCELDDYPCQYCRENLIETDCANYRGCEKWVSWFKSAWRSARRAEITPPDIIGLECNVFDVEEIYPNCTVQIWKNSVTGECSIGWRRNDGNEYGMQKINADEGDQGEMP